MALRERIARMEVSRRIDLERLHEEFVLSARDYAKLSALVAELEGEFAEFQKEVVPQIEALEGMLAGAPSAVTSSTTVLTSFEFQCCLVFYLWPRIESHRISAHCRI